MVSKELEDAAKSYSIEMYRTTRNELLAEKCKWAFISGARFEQRQEAVPSKELADEIDVLSKRYPEISFAKLSRIAVRIAKWQKGQDELTASDKGMADEIIIHLKRIEEEYRLNLTKEIQWLRNITTKGE